MIQYFHCQVHSIAPLSCTLLHSHNYKLTKYRQKYFRFLVPASNLVPPVPTVTQVWELVLLQSINIKISVSTLLYQYLDDVVPAHGAGAPSSSRG